MAKRKIDDIDILINKDQPDRVNIANEIQAKLDQRERVRDIKEQYLHKDYATYMPKGKKPKGMVRIVVPLTQQERKKNKYATPISVDLPKAEYERLLEYMSKQSREAVKSYKSAQQLYKKYLNYANEKSNDNETVDIPKWSEIRDSMVGQQFFLPVENGNKKDTIFIGDDPIRLLHNAIRSYKKASTNKFYKNMSLSRYLENTVWKYIREDIRKDAEQKLSSNLSQKERENYQEIINSLPRAYTKAETMRNNFAKIVESWPIPNVSSVAAQKILAMSGDTFVQWYIDNISLSSSDTVNQIFNHGQQWAWDSDQPLNDDMLKNLHQGLIEVGLI